MTVLSTSDFHTKKCGRQKRDRKKTNKKKRKHKHHNRIEEQDKNEKSESRQRRPLPSEPDKLLLYPMGKAPKNQSNTEAL
jgi:spore cortex formation protein SpoVR/YcgB (stage V sporulation)